MPPAPRPHVLREATYRQLLDVPPAVALLPWGATEAHNYHLPHGTDIFESEAIAEEAARLAADRGARGIVLPAIPFGNNAQQQDQAATIHLSTTTALAILRDVVTSLGRQGIDRLVIVNAHGGNEFKPLVRDVMLEFPITILVVDFWRIRPDVLAEIFSDPGDHAGDLETSLMLHLRPDLVVLDAAGPGERRPFGLASMKPCGAWTPRLWSQVHPDTGSGDPRGATAAKGAAYFKAITEALADLVVEFAATSGTPRA
jgi:creatinine amidohydrolase